MSLDLWECFIFFLFFLIDRFLTENVHFDCSIARKQSLIIEFLQISRVLPESKISFISALGLKNPVLLMVPFTHSYTEVNGSQT